MAKIRRMFPGGNTSQGFFSFHDNIIGKDRNMLYILKGMPGGGKSSMMREIGERALNSGYDIEYHHCPSDPDSIDGIVINGLGIGIIDGTPPHAVDPIYPGLIDKIVDLARFIDREELKKYREQIIEAKANNKQAYRKAFNYFKGAKCIYDEIETSNSSHVDVMKVNREIRDIIEEIFKEEKEILSDRGFKLRHLFSNAYTPDGYVDYTEFILSDISNRYYIQGDIGTGKSKIFNRILEEVKLRDYHAEIYYNSMMPDRIESILIFEIDTIISANRAIEKFPHISINLNDYFDTSYIDEKDYRIYETLIERGIEGLKGAKKNHLALERAYKQTVDYESISDIREEIWKEIKTYF
ncbi:MAG: hypothetical protein AB2375_00730 [Tissierellaceae bacterium]